MGRIEPVGAPPAERVELDALQDEAAVGEFAGLPAVEVVGLQHLQLQRHRQPVLDAPFAQPHQHLAALDEAAHDQRLQAGEVGEPVGVGGRGEVEPEPVRLRWQISASAARARGISPVPTMLLTSACTALPA